VHYSIKEAQFAQCRMLGIDSILAEPNKLPLSRAAAMA
jgi:hypothetical protein